ncbi:MAG: NFACT family protein, partial [Ignavibacteria bacterium]
MLNNYFTIRETADYLNKNVPGYIIHEIYTQEKNKLLIELLNENNKDEKILEYSIEKGFQYLLFKENFSKAKKNYVNLFEEAYYIKINSVNIYNDDRVICFEIGEDAKLMFTFFSNKANAYLIEGGVIKGSFKDNAANLNKNIEDVIFPKKDPAKVYDENISIETYLKKNFRTYGDDYLKEIMHRGRLLKEDIIDESKAEKIMSELTVINKELNTPEFILYRKNNETLISLINLRHLKDHESSKFENINELQSEYLKLKYRYEKTEALKNLRIKEFAKKIENVRHKINSLKVQLTHSSDSESLRIAGDTLLANLDKINKGDKKFSYTTEDGIEEDIKLKEDLTPAENAQNYFEKYKKQKKSVSILKDKIIIMNTEKAKLESELAKVNEMTGYKTLIKEEKRSERNKNDETSRF